MQLPRKKVLYVADLHYALKQFDWLVEHANEFDPIIIGGDLLDLGSALDIDVQILVVERYLHRIREVSRVLVCSGNHDGDGRNESDESVARWIEECRADGLFVNGDSVDLDGTRVTLCPWWDGPQSLAELEALLEREARSVRGPWIWVHHAPPAGSPVAWTGRKCAGDMEVREWITKYQPAMVLAGHIHNSPFTNGGAWVDRIGETWVFNPGRQLAPYPTYIVLDLDEMSAEWLSLAGRSVQKLSVADG